MPEEAFFLPAHRPPYYYDVHNRELVAGLAGAWTCMLLESNITFCRESAAYTHAGMHAGRAAFLNTHESTPLSPLLAWVLDVDGAPLNT